MAKADEPDGSTSRQARQVMHVDLSVAGEEDPGAALDLASDSESDSENDSPTAAAAAAVPAGRDPAPGPGGAPRPDPGRRPPGLDA